MIYYAQGDAILSAEEMFQPSVMEAVLNFHTDLSAGKKPSPITFSSGELTLETAVTGFDAGLGAARVEFEKIGMGLPLTIMIREVYTGKHPKGGLFSGGKDMLLTSAIKSIVFNDAKPHALNFLKTKVFPKSRMQRPPATQQGTPIIFYSPALLQVILKPIDK